MTQTKAYDPLGPLDAITSIFAWVCGVGLIIGTVLVLTNGSTSLFGMGQDEVCVTTDARSFPTVESDEVTDIDREDYGLRPNTTFYPESTTVCDQKPGPWSQVLVGLSQAPTPLVFLGFVVLVQRTIRYARRNGLFSDALAVRIERLGWLLLIGLFASAGIEWFAEGRLLSSMVTDEAGARFSVSVSGIIGAYGLVTVGRVMLRATRLQEDSDATI